MTVDPEALASLLDVFRTLDGDPGAADTAAAWLAGLDRQQRDDLRPQLRRLATTLQSITHSLDDAVARDAASAPAALRRPSPAQWFEAFAHGVATGDVAAVHALAGIAPPGAEVAAGVTAWLDAGLPTRGGEMLHMWARLRAAPGWPVPEPGAPGNDAPLIAHAYDARLFAVAGLGWLADDATAHVERLGQRTLWAALARAVRDLDHDELDDAESSYQNAAMRWPAAPESYAGLAAIAEARGFWTDAYGYYEHLASLCASVASPLDRLRAALFWVRSTRRASPDATGALLALAGHPQLRGDRALCRRTLELAVAGECPRGASWALDARIALAELLAADRDPAAGPAFSDIASGFRADHAYDKAAQFSRRAIEAGRSDAAAYWTLADDLRLCEPIDPARLDEATALWQHGFATERPTWATSWGLIARAMIADAYRGPLRRQELGATLWFGEWAAVMASDSALRWCFLARFYRSVNADATALAMVLRALELDPELGLAHYEHAMALANIGRSREALDELDQRAAAATGEADRRWIRSVRGYLLVNLGDDRAALAELEQGCEPWATPIAAQVMRRLGDRAGADRVFREIWDDAARPALIRAAVAVWIGRARDGEALLEPGQLDATDDPHDVAAARAWLRAAQGDWEAAERQFAAAVDAIRVPRQALMLAAELRDVIGLLGEGGGGAEAARRGAAWRRRLDARPPIELGAADITAERARATRLVAGTRYAGFAAITALREAASPGVVAAAAAQLRALAPELCDAVLASIADAWMTRADAALAADDSALAGELYARAAAIADSVALCVRRAWLAAASSLAPAVATPFAERAVAGAFAPVLGQLVDKLPPRRAWLTIAALAKAARDTGSDAWAQLAGHARAHAPHAFEVCGRPTPPAPLVLEVAPRLLDAAHSLGEALPAARAELAAAAGFDPPEVRTSETASPGTYRIRVDGLVIATGAVAGGSADAATTTELARAVRDAAWDQLARWIDVDRAGHAIATWGAGIEPLAIIPSEAWHGLVHDVPLVLAMMQAAARERIPSRVLGQAVLGRDAGAAVASVYEAIRRTRELCRDWLRERVLNGRSALTLPRALEARLLPRLDRDDLGRGLVQLGDDGRALATEVIATAGRARTIVVTRDPRTRFAVALILAAGRCFVPAVSLEEQLV